MENHSAITYVDMISLYPNVLYNEKDAASYVEEMPPMYYNFADVIENVFRIFKGIYNISVNILNRPRAQVLMEQRYIICNEEEFGKYLGLGHYPDDIVRTIRNLFMPIWYKEFYYDE